MKKRRGKKRTRREKQRRSEFIQTSILDFLKEEEPESMPEVTNVTMEEILQRIEALECMVSQGHYSTQPRGGGPPRSQPPRKKKPNLSIPSEISDIVAEVKKHPIFLARKNLMG